MLTNQDFTPHKPALSGIREDLSRYVAIVTAAAAGMMVLGVFGFNFWFARELIRSAESRESQWQSFQLQMAQEMEELTHLAGLTTSHELCPVRFRFRTQDYEPALATGAFSNRDQVRLVATSLPEFSTRTAFLSDVCDFGLVPPGRYRLEVELGAYDLEWDFQVHAGAVVDRVVMYPPQPPPYQPRLEVAGNVGEPILGGVCIVKAAPIVVGDWAWNYHESLAAIADHRLSERQLNRVIDQSPELRDRMADENIPILTGVPFLVCDVQSVHYLLQQEGSTTLCKTIHFPSGTERPMGFGGGGSSPPPQCASEPQQLRWNPKDEIHPLIVRVASLDLTDAAHRKTGDLADNAMRLAMFPVGPDRR